MSVVLPDSNIMINLPIIQTKYRGKKKNLVNMWVTVPQLNCSLLQVLSRDKHKISRFKWFSVLTKVEFCSAVGNSDVKMIVKPVKEVREKPTGKDE